jgi:hypothetical protein
MRDLAITLLEGWGLHQSVEAEGGLISALHA